MDSCKKVSSPRPKQQSSSATIEWKHACTNRKRTRQYKCRITSFLLHRREQRPREIPPSNSRSTVQGGSYTTHNHTQDTHDAASHNPPAVSNSALQEVGPANFGRERRCNVAKRNESLGRRSGNKIERSGQYNNIENW